MQNVKNLLEWSKFDFLIHVLRLSCFALQKSGFTTIYFKFTFVKVNLLEWGSMSIAMSFKNLLGLWRMLEAPYWCIASWSLVVDKPKFWIFALCIGIEGAKSIMYSKSWLVIWTTLKVPDLGLASWTWYRCDWWSFDIYVFNIAINFENAKNINVL